MNSFIAFIILCIIHNAINFGYAQVMVPKIIDPPHIDGRVNDNIWESGALINEFFQREPNEGTLMTEKTEVFILYDNDNIYFGIKCYQDQKTITAKELQRGAPLPFDDRIHIVIDTYLDGRNAFVFEMNPLGSVGDALVSDNGRLVNRSWEGLFIGKSKITDIGWEAELQIPFKTLSFDPNKNSWGLYMNRFLETIQEWGSWPVANIDMPEYAVSDAGIITGLDGITQGIGLDIAPYALTGYDAKNGEATDFKLNGGTDIYYRVTPNLKASLSINTDFAEIEADARQINLSRFNIRLEEKRNFFLDGADLYSYGIEGRRTEAPSGKLSPFFSRRMGLNADGTPIPINYAAKLTGRINNWNIGLLHVNERHDSTNTNSSVARISYNIGQLSSIGMISTFGNAINENKNLVTGIDINLVTSKFKGDKNAALMLFGIKSTTENIHSNDVSWGALINYPNDRFNFKIGHQQIGENFFAGLGFVPRINIKESWGEVFFEPRINKYGLRQYSIGGSFNYVTDFSNILQSKSLTFAPFGIKFNTSDEIKYSLVHATENLLEDFNIYSDFTIEAGLYEWWENRISLETAGSRDIFGNIEYSVGNFFTGRKNSTKLELNWKIIIPVFIGSSITVDNVKLPQGDFRADILGLSLNILFSPNITLYNLLQYDSQSQITGFQTRFRWILKPGNEILLVWNSGYSTTSSERLVMNENSLRMKLKYNIRF